MAIDELAGVPVSRSAGWRERECEQEKEKFFLVFFIPAV